MSAVLERLVANRTQAAVAAVQRGWLAALTVLVVLLILAPAAHATSTPSGLRAALTREMRSAGAWSGAWVDDGSGRVVFKWKAGAKRVPASVQKLVTAAAAGPPRTGGAVRDRNRGRRDDQPTECLTEPLPARLGRPQLRHHRPRRLARKVGETGLEDVGGRIYGDESFFDRRAPRFRVSPYVGPLSALAFNHGSMLPLAGDGRAILPSSWQAGCASRCDRAGRRGSARARRQCACRRDHPGHDGSPPLEALVRHTNHVSDNYYAETLLKGLGARSGTTGSGGGRRNRVEVRARAGLPRQDRRRLRPLSIQCDLTQRRRPPPAEGR